MANSQSVVYLPLLDTSHIVVADAAPLFGHLYTYIRHVSVIHDSLHGLHGGTSGDACTALTVIKLF